MAALEVSGTAEKSLSRKEMEERTQWLIVQ
jgi:hypothetical protein